ncbi:TniQ family protein [Tardiphaga sp. 215_C5_N2_1]|uniref:TniQ family protein n=1 Tax=Tardiphaga sp. 215_C5_N2_1 TaxID=3240774 RepID=UPI003F89823D
MAARILPLVVVPAEDEPAHGILLRLAERNGILMPGLIPSMTDLTPSRLREGNGALRLASILGCEPAAFMGSTPVADMRDHLVVRGERLGRYCDFRVSARRLCPHCIAEGPHQRFWFDLEFITTCPKHEVGLISTCACGSPLSWQDVSVERCVRCAGGSVAVVIPSSGSPDVIEMDRWALGRLGVGKTVGLPVLDKMPLKQAIDTIGQIGALDIGGYRDHWVEARELDMPEVQVRARGFEILKHRRLDGLLDNVYDQFLRSGHNGVAKMHTAYGWYGHWFSFLRPENYPSEISDLVLANAERKFDVRRGAFRQMRFAAHPIASTL